MNEHDKEITSLAKAFYQARTGQGSKPGFWTKTLLTLPLVYAFAFCQGVGNERSYLPEKADRAAMVMYKPVGNGGAMMEAYKGPSGERKKMYDSMRKIREAVIGKSIW
jgi:hypothetical protein